MQVAFNALLHGALQLPLPTQIEYLHILGKFPPPMVLTVKQLFYYVASLKVPPAP